MPVVTARATPRSTPDHRQRQPARPRAARQAVAFAGGATRATAIADRCVAALSMLVLFAAGIDAGWR